MPRLTFFLSYLWFLFFGSTQVSIHAQDIHPKDQVVIDSLREMIRHPNAHDTTKIKGYVELSEVLYRYNADSVKINCEHAIEIYEEAQIPSSGQVFECMTFWMGEACNNMGYYWNLLGNLPFSIDWMEKGLSYRLVLKDNYSISNSYNNLGAVLSSTDDCQQAEIYYRKALNIQRNENNLAGAGSTLNNIALCYMRNNKKDSAMLIFKEALAIEERIDDKKIHCLVLCSIGQMYSDMDSTELAIHYLRASIDMASNAMIYNALSVPLVSLGNIYFDQQNYNEAYKLGKKALDIEISASRAKDQTKAYFLLYKISKVLNNPTEALKHYENYIILKDQVVNAENSKAAINQKYKYKYLVKATKDSLRQRETINLKNAELEANQAREMLRKAEDDTQKKWLFAGLGTMLIFGLIMLNRYTVIKKQKFIINAQKLDAEQQKVKIEEQHLRLTHSHKEINDSIAYSQRLQNATLPARKQLSNFIKEHHVIFMPKDVVSGDFYWLYELEDTVLIAVADCTGHGVPGAMMTFVCTNALNQSVKEFGLKAPAAILNKAREIIINTFSASVDAVHDGMDIALLALPKNQSSQKNITFAGANNPIWIVRDKTGCDQKLLDQPRTVCFEDKVLFEIKGDKQPIGKYVSMAPFKEHHIPLLKNDTLYLFSDGYMDQFGGNEGKKLKHLKFKELMLTTHQMPLKEQGDFMEQYFIDWKGYRDQIDDVCVLSMRL